MSTSGNNDDNHDPDDVFMHNGLSNSSTSARTGGLELLDDEDLFLAKALEAIHFSESSVSSSHGVASDSVLTEEGSTVASMCLPAASSSSSSSSSSNSTSFRSLPPSTAVGRQEKTPAAAPSSASAASEQETFFDDERTSTVRAGSSEATMTWVAHPDDNLPQRSNGVLSVGSGEPAPAAAQPRPVNPEMERSTGVRAEMGPASVSVSGRGSGRLRNESSQTKSKLNHDLLGEWLAQPPGDGSELAGRLPPVSCSMVDWRQFLDWVREPSCMPGPPASALATPVERRAAFDVIRSNNRRDLRDLDISQLPMSALYVCPKSGNIIGGSSLPSSGPASCETQMWLAAALRANNTLTSLTLPRHRIPHPRELINALRQHSVLKSLSLSRTRIPAALVARLLTPNTLSSVGQDAAAAASAGASAAGAHAAVGAGHGDVCSPSDTESASFAKVSDKTRSSSISGGGGPDDDEDQDEDDNEGDQDLFSNTPFLCNLTNLDLNSNVLSDWSAGILASAVAQSTSLRSLSVGGNRLSSVAAEKFADCLLVNSCLQSIDFLSNDLGERGVLALARSLGSRYWPSTATTAAANTVESGNGSDQQPEAPPDPPRHYNTTLKRLRISRNNCGDEGAKALASMLAHNRSLQELCARFSNIGVPGVQALSKTLANRNFSLTSLKLSGNTSIGDEGIVALADALKTGSAPLAVLKLRRTGLGPEGVATLANALVRQSTLTTLTLDENRVGEAGGLALAKALAQNDHLRGLSLVETQAGPRGVAAMAQALLADNTTLTTLDLSKNTEGVDTPAALLLADLVAANGAAPLRTLRLRNNTNLAGPGGVALARALRTNSTLTSLSLSRTNFSEMALSELAAATAENSSLLTLRLSSNHVSYENVRQLGMMLESNRTLVNLDLAFNNFANLSPLDEALRANTRLTHLSALRRGPTLVSRLWFNQRLRRQRKNAARAAVVAFLAAHRSVRRQLLQASLFEPFDQASSSTAAAAAAGSGDASDESSLGRSNSVSGPPASLRKSISEKGSLIDLRDNLQREDVDSRTATVNSDQQLKQQRREFDDPNQGGGLLDHVAGSTTGRVADTANDTAINNQDDDDDDGELSVGTVSSNGSSSGSSYGFMSESSRNDTDSAADTDSGYQSERISTRSNSGGDRRRDVNRPRSTSLSLSTPSCSARSRSNSMLQFPPLAFLPEWVAVDIAKLVYDTAADDWPLSLTEQLKLST